MWQVLSEPFGLRLSATLLHFIWQGAVIAVLAATLLRVLRSAAPHVRYAVAYGALVAMAATPLVTWSLVRPGTSTSGEIAAASPAGLGADSHALAAELGAPSSAYRSAGASARRPAAAAPPLALPNEISTPAAVRRPLVDRLLAWFAPLQPYLLGGWFFGVAICAARLLAGIGGVWWLRGDRSAVPVWLNVAIVGLGRKLGVNASGRVFASPRVSEAVAVGFWRPIVLVPVSWLTELPADMVEAIVAHELAHIRRFDLWAVFGQRLIETGLFYHPAVWWLSRRVSTEREMCCDAVAVAATGRRSTYVRALEAVGRRNAACGLKDRGSKNVSFAFATSFRGEEDMVLLKRVRQVLGVPTEAGRTWPAGAVIAALALGAWALGAGFTGSQADADAPREGEKPKAEAGREGEKPKAEGERRPEEGSRREGAAREGAAREGAREGERRPAEGAREGDRRPAAEGERGPARGTEPSRRNSEVGGPDDFKPQTEREEALVKMIMGLRAELASLRRQVEQQGRTGAPRREGDRPAVRDGERPAGAARDGDRPKAGPRDGEGAPRTGPRDGEGAPRTGPRDGERPAGGAREGDRPAGAREGDAPAKTAPRGEG